MDILATYAAAHPDKACLIWDDNTQSYEETNRAVNRMANALSALGVKRGDTAVWCGYNAPEGMWFTHAARKLGLVSVPLNCRFTAPETPYVIEDSGAPLAMAGPAAAELGATGAAGMPALGAAART